MAIPPGAKALLLVLAWAASLATALACPAGQFGVAPLCVKCPAGTFTLPPTVASNSDASACSAAYQRPNVLLLVADDLKPVIGGHYGDARSRSPNLNALQSKGVTYVNAHNQAAECTPSRASFLTGLRPDVNGVITINGQLRGVYPNLITLPQRFKNQGYFVAGVGKVFDGRSAGGARVEDAISWSIPVYNPFPGLYWDPNAGDCGYGDLLRSPQAPSPLVQCSLSSQGDAAYPNYNLTSHAIGLLDTIASPFFLALGLQRPHMPFCSPDAYWRQWNRSAMLRPTANRTAIGMWAGALHDNGEAATYSDWPTLAPLLPSDAVRARFVHGYYAASSYSDAEFGRILDALFSSPHANNTIIVAMADHGMHLGDHQLFGKWTVYEQATRTPLIIAGAAVGPKRWGTQISSPVELLDLYPTLSELAGLVSPLNPPLDGISLVPTLSQLNFTPAVRGVAVVQYPAFCCKNIMSYGLRGTRWRYVVHLMGTGAIFARNEIKHARIYHEEIYDMVADPNETVSLLQDPRAQSALSVMRSIFSKYRSTTWRGVWTAAVGQV